MSRLALSDADKEVRDWFTMTAKSLRCKTYHDAMGNIFAVRPGRNVGPATFMGSHLDTQPKGGRYDGILGVLAGIECLRVLEEQGIETNYPIGVVNWTKYVGQLLP
jgi:acetylornithine deacetylase/succinyl-diaminopimelate desuccinylase-like protein